MKALIYDEPFRMSMADLPLPVAGDDDVLVQVKAVGLCGSDVHGFSGKTGRRQPGMVMGHEIAGEVAEVGKGVTRFGPGQRVAVQPIIYCGQCSLCRAGLTSICLNKQMLGVNTGIRGGLAQYVAVPQRNVFGLPPDFPFSLAALVEPFAVGVSAARHARPTAEETVLIVGAGLIGQTILRLVREQTPGPIYIVDNNEAKLAVAAQAGASPLNFARVDPVAAVMAKTGGLGVDVAIEAVGVAASVRTAMAATMPGGRVVWIGNSQKTIELDMQDVVVKAKSIQGVYCYTDADFGAAIAYLDGHRQAAARFADLTVPFEEAPALFGKLARQEVEVFRAVAILSDH